MFGLRDVMSGWEGDCRACNLRWYRGQLLSVSRDTSVRNLWGAGQQATALILRFAGLDLIFLVSRVSFQRKLHLLKAPLTCALDSDDEYFDDDAVAVKFHPFTLLDDTYVKSSALLRDFADELKERNLSLLDVVVTYLMPRVSSLNGGAHIHRVTKQDYVFEPCWGKYVSEGRYWMWNCETEEWFFVDAPGPWIVYRWKKRYWWLNGKRWFWERPGE